MRETKRRKMGYWEPFNVWWREYVAQHDKRPKVHEMKKWYESNAERVWGGTGPTWDETKKHSKGMRRIEDISDYFRQYRRGRRKKAAGCPIDSDTSDSDADELMERASTPDSDKQGQPRGPRKTAAGGGARRGRPKQEDTADGAPAEEPSRSASTGQNGPSQSAQPACNGPMANGQIPPAAVMAFPLHRDDSGIPAAQQQQKYQQQHLLMQQQQQVQVQQYMPQHDKQALMQQQQNQPKMEVGLGAGPPHFPATPAQHHRGSSSSLISAVNQLRTASTAEVSVMQQLRTSSANLIPSAPAAVAAPAPPPLGMLHAHPHHVNGQHYHMKHEEPEHIEQHHPVKGQHLMMRQQQHQDSMPPHGAGGVSPPEPQPASHYPTIFGMQVPGFFRGWGSRSASAGLPPGHQAPPPPHPHPGYPGHAPPLAAMPRSMTMPRQWPGQQAPAALPPQPPPPQAAPVQRRMSPWGLIPMPRILSMPRSMTAPPPQPGQMPPQQMMPPHQAHAPKAAMQTPFAIRADTTAYNGGGPPSMLGMQPQAESYMDSSAAAPPPPMQDPYMTASPPDVMPPPQAYSPPQPSYSPPTQPYMQAAVPQCHSPESTVSPADPCLASRTVPPQQAMYMGPPQHQPTTVSDPYMGMPPPHQHQQPVTSDPYMAAPPPAALQPQTQQLIQPLHPHSQPAAPPPPHQLPPPLPPQSHAVAQAPLEMQQHQPAAPEPLPQQVALPQHASPVQLPVPVPPPQSHPQALPSGPPPDPFRTKTRVISLTRNPELDSELQDMLHHPHHPGGDGAADGQRPPPVRAADAGVAFHPGYAPNEAPDLAPILENRSAEDLAVMAGHSPLSEAQASSEQRGSGGFIGRLFTRGSTMQRLRELFKAWAAPESGDTPGGHDHATAGGSAGGDAGPAGTPAAPPAVQPPAPALSPAFFWGRSNSNNRSSVSGSPRLAAASSDSAPNPFKAQLQRLGSMSSSWLLGKRSREEGSPTTQTSTPTSRKLQRGISGVFRPLMDMVSFGRRSGERSGNLCIAAVAAAAVAEVEAQQRASADVTAAAGSAAAGGETTEVGPSYSPDGVHGSVGCSGAVSAELAAGVAASAERPPPPQPHADLPVTMSTDGDRLLLETLDSQMLAALDAETSVVCTEMMPLTVAGLAQPGAGGGNVAAQGAQVGLGAGVLPYGPQQPPPQQAPPAPQPQAHLQHPAPSSAAALVRGPVITTGATVTTGAPAPRTAAVSGRPQPQQPLYGGYGQAQHAQQMPYGQESGMMTSAWIPGDQHQHQQHQQAGHQGDGHNGGLVLRLSNSLTEYFKMVWGAGGGGDGGAPANGAR